MSKLSVNEFRKLLKEQVDEVASQNGWNVSKTSDRGFAFQRWLFDTISRYEVGLDDADPDEVCLHSNDLGADLVFDDPTRQYLLICQAKYQAAGKMVDEGEVNDFFGRHEHFSDRKWVLKHGSQAASEVLADYGEKIRGGYTVAFYFFSTGDASPRVQTLAERMTSSYASRGMPIRCELFDFSGLKDYYQKSLSLEESAPAEVVLRFPVGYFFEKPEPFRTLIGVLKGNELRGLFQKHKEALYAWNIRGYLGNRGINQEIFNTAQNHPENFFYFNNGVSAICTDFRVEGDNELHAQNFQVINGAQTISTLAKASSNPEIDVLFRLTKTKAVKTEKGLNRDIIQFNNTQNAIKDSDFRANDEIQLWLEEKFKKTKPTAVIPQVTYHRKRSTGRKGLGYALRLEELAKIRYAFLVEPTLIHASPKALWTLKEDDGKYQESFGVNGELLPAWSDETFNETLLALCFYLKIDTDAKEKAKKNPELKFLRRLRFHTLSLAGTYCRDKGVDPKEVLARKDAFQELWLKFWPVAGNAVEDAHSSALEQQTTMFAFVRSEERWAQMSKRLTRKSSIVE